MVESMVTALVAFFSKFLSKELVVFFVSILPIIELRGGILAGYALRLPMITTVFFAVIGNLLPIPFILWFVEHIMTFMKDHNIMKNLIEKIEKRALHKSEGMANTEFLALMIFVAIPLPGTGGWTGALIAVLLKMDKKRALLSVCLGVLIAGVIMTMISYGLLAFLGI